MMMMSDDPAEVGGLTREEGMQQKFGTFIRVNHWHLRWLESNEVEKVAGFLIVGNNLDGYEVTPILRPTMADPEQKEGKVRLAEFFADGACTESSKYVLGVETPPGSRTLRTRGVVFSQFTPISAIKRDLTA